MPRDAVSRTANVERNGGHEWVKSDDAERRKPLRKVYAKSLWKLQTEKYLRNFQAGMKILKIYKINHFLVCSEIIATFIYTDI